MRIIDWLARTTMLVLASMATLALIGALANVSNSQLGDAFPGARVAPGEPAPSAIRSATRPAPPVARADRSAAPSMTGAPVPPPGAADREQVRWLRALTYAVLALAAFVAVGVIALARIASHLARIAGR